MRIPPLVLYPRLDRFLLIPPVPLFRIVLLEPRLVLALLRDGVAARGPATLEDPAVRFLLLEELFDGHGGKAVAVAEDFGLEA